MSSNLDDFICHDDIFWKRTGKCRSKQATFLLPDFQESQLQPQYVDADTVAAHTGIPVDAPLERTTRQRVCQHILSLGVSAPSVGGSGLGKRLERIYGINRDQQVPFATRAIGALLR